MILKSSLIAQKSQSDQCSAGTSIRSWAGRTPGSILRNTKRFFADKKYFVQPTLARQTEGSTQTRSLQCLCSRTEIPGVFEGQQSQSQRSLTRRSHFWRSFVPKDTTAAFVSLSMTLSFSPAFSPRTIVLIRIRSPPHELARTPPAACVCVRFRGCVCTPGVHANT